LANISDTPVGFQFAQGTLKVLCSIDVATRSKECVACLPNFECLSSFGWCAAVLFRTPKHLLWIFAKSQVKKERGKEMGQSAHMNAHDRACNSDLVYVPEETSKTLAAKNAPGSQPPIRCPHTFLSHSFPRKGCGESQL